MGVEPQEILAVLKKSTAQIDRLLQLAPAGRLLRDGVQVVLTGPTNVGKSSLFNRLLEEDRALVDAEAGTTRDVVSASVEKNGTRFVFHDTAGLREEAGRVEKMGIGRTLKAAKEADIILALHGPGQPLASLDGDEYKGVVIPVVTKADLNVAREDKPQGVITSSTDGRGLPELWSALFSAVESFRINEAIAMGVVLNERHLHKLELCRHDLGLLVIEIENAEKETEGLGVEVVGTMLSSVLSRFGEISGRVFSEQLLESIFSRFCVGK